MWAQFSRFAIKMTKDEARSCTHQGQCDSDVLALTQSTKMVSQLNKIDPDDIRDELREYGAWDQEELSDDRLNRDRIVWIAAGNIVDEVGR